MARQDGPAFLVLAIGQAAMPVVQDRTIHAPDGDLGGLTPLLEGLDAQGVLGVQVARARPFGLADPSQGHVAVATA